MDFGAKVYDGGKVQTKWLLAALQKDEMLPSTLSGFC
jgi:hypothetical protein